MAPHETTPRPRLRIAWFGHDWGIDCAREAIERGHAVQRVFTDDLSRGRRTRETRAFGGALGVPVHVGRPAPDVVEALRGAVDVIVCAGFPWRIPVSPDGPRGLNIHPTLLPQGRGPQPFRHVILRGETQTGVTVHELAERMDHGAILHQEAMPVLPDETHGSLSARSVLLGRRLLGEVLEDLDGFWDRRAEQEEGSWWPVTTDAQAVLPLDGPVADIDRVTRAFEPGKSVATLGRATRGVESAVVWEQEHAHVPGTVVRVSGRDALVAGRDGYALLRLAPRRAPGKSVAGRAYRRSRRTLGRRR